VQLNLTLFKAFYTPKNGFLAETADGDATNLALTAIISSTAISSRRFSKQKGNNERYGTKPVTAIICSRLINDLGLWFCCLSAIQIL
jgi:hypothetical protein